MLGLFKHKKKGVVVETPKEILEHKKEMRKASESLSQNSQKVKKILSGDIVTLQIHRAVRHG
jgi:hypothetical protein